MLIDLAKYRLYKGLIEEAEKTARFIEFYQMTAPDDAEAIMRIDRAVLRYFALLRRIDTMQYMQEVADQ